MGMSAESMEHMAPVPIDGITDAPSDVGGVPLKGVRRDGALEFKIDARPVRWPILPDQELTAYAYDGIVPGPTIRVDNGERVRIRFTNDLPVETTIHWHGIGVPNSEDGVPGITQRAIQPGEEYTYEFTARPAGEPDGGGTFLYHSHVDEDRQMPPGRWAFHCHIGHHMTNDGEGPGGLLTVVEAT
jgi:FtsP/CotA-like multicopper oxidase with cupredoxin domain